MGVQPLEGVEPLIQMKTSFVVTILNESETIESLLNSLASQTKIPNQILIVDGGSTDRTVFKIREFISKHKEVGKRIQLYQKPGNRSIGRNYGVEKATGEIILFSDAGCTLKNNWGEEIIMPFQDKETDVVSGYYEGKAKSDFQKALIPYVLVMPDKVNPDSFLPATRSMAIRKEVFEGLDGFDEKLSHNEDYAFAKKLEKQKKKIVFTKNAIVYWTPRNNLSQAFNMFYRFAKGDIQAGIVRPQVLFLFARYAIGINVLIAAFITQNQSLWYAIGVGLILYIIWSIQKNYNYVKKVSALFWLPVIQFTADVSVMLGSIVGLFSKS